MLWYRIDKPELFQRLEATGESLDSKPVQNRLARYVVAEMKK